MRTVWIRLPYAQLRHNCLNMHARLRRRPSLRLARRPRQVKALVTDNPPSMARPSEYPLDGLIGVGVKVAAMAEQDSLRLP